MSKRCKRWKKPYDWPGINEAWIRSPLESLKAFCAEQGLNYSTAKQYLKVKEKTELIKNARPQDSAFQAETRERDQAVQLDRRRGLCAAATERAAIIAKEVLEGAMEDFTALRKGGGYRSPGEAGHLALRAGNQFRELSAELEGIPTKEDEHTWSMTVGFWPFGYQRDFLFDMPSTLRKEGIEAFIFAFVGGLGSGKTVCGAQKAGEIAWRNRGLSGAIYAPTYRMLEDTTKRVFLATVQEKGLSYKYRASDNMVTLFGDTRIMFRSMENPEHLRGPELAWGWIDEGLQMTERTAFDVILGRIRHPKAKERCLIFTGTPNGLNWGYDLLVEEAEQNKVQIYRGRTQDNLALPQDYHDRLLGTYDSRFAQQELDAEFLDVFAGRAYWGFGRDYHVVLAKNIPFKAELPLELCVDFNVAPMCWNVCQEFRYDGGYVSYAVDEIHIESANTQTAIKEFLLRYGDHKGGVRIWGDATGQARHTSASRTDYEIILQGLKAAQVPKVEVKVGRSNPLETDRIVSMNARFCNAKGERRLFISKKCKYTIRDFERVAFLPGTRQLDKKDKTLTHHSDAIGYYIDRRFPVRGVKVRLPGQRIAVT